MMHSSTRPGSTFARRTASATTRAPSSVADSDFSAPRNLPVGVRTAETRTASRTLAYQDGRHRIPAEEVLQPRQDDRRRSADFMRPLPAGGVDDERSVLEPHAGAALDGGSNGGAPGKRDFSGRERCAA